MRKLIIGFVSCFLLSCSSEKISNKRIDENTETKSNNKIFNIEKSHHLNISHLESQKKTLSEMECRGDLKESNSKYDQAKLEEELIMFLEALEVISKEAQKQESIINEKAKNANSREDDDVVTRLTINLFERQKKALNSIPLTKIELLGIRNKMIQATDIAIQANQQSIDIRQPTLEDEKLLIEQFNIGRDLSNQAKSELMILTERAMNE